MQIIYLAAGNSRRFFSQKLFYNYQGQPLYMHGLQTLLAVIQDRNDCTLKIVYQDKQIGLNHPDLDTVYSPNSNLGLSYSIKKGIENVEDDILFMVADQPYIRKETILQFIDAFYASKKEVGSVICNGTPGNPTIFRKDIVPELQTLKEDQGGRRIIKQHDCFYYEIENPMELKDIDSIQDI